MTPRVVRFNGSNQPETIYIGRGSKWGNPFRIGWDGILHQRVIQESEWRDSTPLP